MNDEKDTKEISALLKKTLPAIQDTNLARDLWPDMLRRLDAASTVQPARIPWFDWALAAILGAILLLFPGTIPALLYHL
jgi:hypothetical protein